MNTKLLRSKLLSLAIAGRLVPQDPNDEPAIELLKRINPKATPITEEVPFTIPDSWCWVRGKQIFLPMESTKPQGDFKYVDVDAVNNKTNQIEKPKSLSQANAPSRATRKLHSNDVLFSMVRPYLRNIALVTEEYKDAIASTGFYVLTPSKAVFPKYLFYMVLSNYVVDGLNAFMKGDNSPSINNNHIEEYIFPLPPVAEQERIVKEVERWFACIEQLERSREALGKAARQTKRTLLSLAISGRLVPQDPNDEPAIELLKRINPKFTPQPTDSPLPPGWTACTMSTLCELTDGERIKGKEMINLDAKYLRGQNEGKTLKEGRTIPVNSLLILVDGENSGEVFRTPIEGYQGSTFKRLVINDNMYEPFVLHVINSHRKRLRENKVGSAIPHLNKKLFRELTVLVPPLAEQERIVRKVEELFAVLDALQ